MQSYSKTKLILRSKVKVSGNDYNGSLNLQNIDSGWYKLLECSFLDNLYNVNDNNKVYVNENATPHTITLTNGYYSHSEFTSILSTVMNSAFTDTITVTYNDNTSKLTISSTGDEAFKFATNTLNPTHYLLGMNESNQTLASLQVSDNPVDLNPRKALFINFDTSSIKQRTISSVNKFPSSFVIKCSSNNFGGLFQYSQSNNYDQYIYIDKKYITYKVINSDGNQISDMPQWECVLELVERKEFV